MVRIEQDRGFSVASGPRREHGRLTVLIGSGDRGAQDPDVVEDACARRERRNSFRAALKLRLVERRPGDTGNAHQVAEIGQR